MTTVFKYHEDKYRKVKRVAQLMLEASPQKPVGERDYFYEARGGDSCHVRLVPVTFDIPSARTNREEMVKSGNLQDAYFFHYALGMGEPTTQEKEDTPWWGFFYWQKLNSACTVCDKQLLEDRALSWDCDHQMCISCALYRTRNYWNEGSRTTTCYTCLTPTRLCIFNGEQCDDKRDHDDVIIFTAF